MHNKPSPREAWGQRWLENPDYGRLLMGLTPEEKDKLYQQELARIEAEKAAKENESDIKDLKPNVSALLSYVGIWVTGIIFLILEKKNHFVRFHAMQSLITFAGLTVIIIIVGIIFIFVPIIGVIVYIIVGILMFILWVVLMYKAYHGERYKLPVSGTLAENLLKPPAPKQPQEPKK